MAPQIFIALDFSDSESALQFAKTIDPKLAGLKVGITLFTKAGPKIVEQLHALGFKIFLDLKYHDIPQQVYGAVKAAAELGVFMLNVHALGGLSMLQAAREAIPQQTDASKLIAVTILTSADDSDLATIGISKPVKQLGLELAKLAATAALDGVVCSAQEAQLYRANFAQDFLLVTPGIRPAGSAFVDQKRIMTPKAAKQAGSDFLVIGRPITQAAEPKLALTEIIESL